MAEERTLPLLRGSITLNAALEEEEDMLLELSYPEKRLDFFLWLIRHREDIESVVSYHLGLRQVGDCRMGEVKEWIHGSFNVCIPVHVDKWDKRVLIRFPLPYKVGESTCPGNADEKLRCEAATFIWMRENCPDIPIPRLWAFGFPGGQSFTRPENMSLTTRMFWYLKRYISRFLGYTLPCEYIVNQRQSVLEHKYLVMDYIDAPGIQMLSKTWDQHSDDGGKKANFMRDLSRIILSLSRRPVPCIGSWTLDPNGALQLSNRPLTFRLQSFENAGIPTNIDRNSTYSTADSYYLDILSCHDSRILHQPNSILDEEDGRAQMANLAIMRALLPHFTDRKLRQGPFFYKLSDLHQSNIFVDSEWHIKCLVDLEWACSAPAEMLRPPYWLTSLPVDFLTGKNLDSFSEAKDEFLEIFEEEEKLFPLNGDYSYRTNLMRKGWTIGNFWYFHALESPKGLYNLFLDHVQPRYTSSHREDSDFMRIVSEYWTTGTQSVISTKLKDKEAYEKKLRQCFETSSWSDSE